MSVTAGANGAVLFDARSAEEVVSRFAGKSVTYVCFRMGDGGARALGHWGGYAPTVGLRYLGLRTPFDGCEVQGSSGHRWLDRLGSHSAVEVASTAAATRYFEDRAAARDLALFVRSGKVQRLRRLSGDRLAQALAREYGSRIARLAGERRAPALRQHRLLDGGRPIGLPPGLGVRPRRRGGTRGGKDRAGTT